jgi:ppGpp synthetase/RelA/SpoT-type nucleotidyltranferase
MARTRRSIAGRFLKEIEVDRPSYELAAQQATALIKEILVNSPALIHLITARCKSGPSLWLKLCEKKYGQPKRQVTDLVAARVITYYKNDVPIVLKALNDALEVDPHKSMDKLEDLEAVEFGYTSVHLIARTKGGWSTSPQYFALKDKWFEIQVRSILEHAWAEIEHEVVYKSGIDYPTLIKRRFARIAGAIEMLEDEFLALRDHQQQLIDNYKTLYLNGEEGAAEIDSVRLIALLECERPDSPGWRHAAKSGKPFPAHIENRCVKALKRAGIHNARMLRSILNSKALKTAEAAFVREHRLTEPLTHLNTARLVVLLKSRQIFADYFPELLSDKAIQTIIAGTRRRPPRSSG